MPLPGPPSWFMLYLPEILLVGALMAMAVTAARNRNKSHAIRFLGATIGMCLMASANHLLTVFLAVEMASVPSYVLAGILNALGLALTQPTMMALAIDRAERSRMGRAMATYSMFFRAGEAIGATVAGALIGWFGFPGMYYGAIFSLGLGLLGTAINWRSLDATRRSQPH